MINDVENIFLKLSIKDRIEIVKKIRAYPTFSCYEDRFTPEIRHSKDNG